jgi:hypothetical protein
MDSDKRGSDDTGELVFPLADRSPSSRDAKRPPRPIRRPEPIGHGRAILAIATSLGSLAFTILAAIDDSRAFAAIATPGLVSSFALGVVLLACVGLIVHAGVMGVRVPWHFPVAVLAGCFTIGVLMLPDAMRITTKKDAEQSVSPHGKQLTLRNAVVTDVSFAGRDLRGSNLSEATLRHVDLSGTDLSESDLRNARFYDVDLSGAHLCAADLRGADLSGAHGLDSVVDWSYTFYDRRTRLPISMESLLHIEPGPIPDTGRDLLYMCERDVTRRIEA